MRWIVQAAVGVLVIVCSLASGTLPAEAQFAALPSAEPLSDAPIEWSPTCGTPPVDPRTAALVQSALRQAEDTVFVDGELQVPVAVHLITAGKQGKFPRAVVDILINNLNVAFSGTGFSFYLVKLDYTNKRKWYDSCGLFTANEQAMKKKLAYRPAQVLNLYSCKPTGKGLPPGIIGFAYFPWLFPESSFMQGVVVHPGTLPTGAGIPGYDYYGLTPYTR